ncbi:DNAJA3 [Lepeophtheirus salmonis]|uniref:DNAJA3 n=1 Tax=Lepeophtheirus salmonis TaxID=72036 RepID=A0A7R8CFR0_LEPSM|nr:DNAJA3 [Lepeophtheirus salmonis]CAF2762245.1 DNAJA3 [Lepeophtheirus salmonis]
MLRNTTKRSEWIDLRLLKKSKKAYYELAKKYHPDTNKGDTNAQKKFQAVSEAYEILSDDSKRKSYDAYGTAGPEASGFGGANKGFGRGAGGFSSAFGQEFGSQSTSQGHHQMTLSFQEAAKGVTKDISVSVMDDCNSCSGKGGSGSERCPNCNGSGMETVSTGPFMMRSTCRRCSGNGVWIKDPCKSCRGSGRMSHRKSVSVPVPAGIENGQTVRVPTGKHSEAFITFNVRPSDYFQCKGNDVHTTGRISLSQAVLGGTIRIQGIYEDLTVSIPPTTSSHTSIRMKGKGIKNVSGYGYGDHYINIKIVPPKKLDPKQSAILKAFAELEPDTPGTVNGITYNKGGNKVVMEDPNGLVGDLREALSEEKGSDEGVNGLHSLLLLLQRCGFSSRRINCKDSNPTNLAYRSYHLFNWLIKFPMDLIRSSYHN